MADVAFLLLLFFLTATTIDVDSGLRMTLPPPLGEPPVVADRDMLRVLVNAEGLVLIEGKPGEIRGVRETVARHVANEGRDPDLSLRPERALVSLKAARTVSYATYLAVLDAIKLGYRDLHDADARRRFGTADYAAYRARLRPDETDRIVARYPVRISLAEPSAE